MRIDERSLVESLGLTLELLPYVTAFRQDHQPEITARLINGGAQPLRLVMPGHGSFAGWRTPLVEWTFTPHAAGLSTSFGPIGSNTYAIEHDEVFVLAPGESRDLGGWIIPPCFPSSPEFSASITYFNDPTIPVRGVTSRPHDEAALALIRQSDRCRVQSNEIRVSFQEYPADALRTWFPELVAMLRERCVNQMSCDDLIALRGDMQRLLGAIRAERGIVNGFRWILSRRIPTCRNREWCDEPRVSVRALILALRRFNVATPGRVSELEQQWRVFRRARGLDLEGRPLPSKPARPSSGVD
jgi:hypothetical protein